MYKQEDREYELKGSFLEMKDYFGKLTRKLQIIITAYKGDADFDSLEKYQKDLAKFKLNLLQVDEACEDLIAKASKEEDAEKRKVLLAKVGELKVKRNYDSLKQNYEACQLDFQNDRQAQRQKALDEELYSQAIVELAQDEKFIMDILKNILIGDLDKLTYDLGFAMAVLTGFFIFVKANHPLLKDIKDSTNIS